MRVVRIEQVGSKLEIGSGFLPYRDARDKGPFDIIPAQAFWLTRLASDQLGPDPTVLGAHLVVVLSGQVRVGRQGEQCTILGPGDLACIDIQSSGLLRFDWDGDAWLFYVLAPGWLPESGDNQARPDDVTRTGRPLSTWIYDDEGSSRSQPFAWPTQMAPVPPPAQWPRSRGAFVTRRDYDDNGYAPGVWHNGPRPQLGFTLNGQAENETGDGTVTRPVAGDMVFIDDVTGAGHVTQGRGDRWMLFVTVAAGEFQFTAER